jgi:3-carboxy-cis,cis-muconate cycloisomerase
LTTFAALFVPAAFRDAVADEAWLGAMLDAELAFARASGAVVDESAFDALLYDIDALAAEGRAAGNPVVPLVRALRARAGEAAHRGATSQDILDTASMLVAQRSLRLLDAELAGLAAGCAALADAHRATPMAGRTLLQQAVPVTFGLVAAGWLVAVLDARDRLGALVLPAQLGGAAGTLAAFGASGPEVLRLYAAELGLAEPTLPWHAHRGPVAALAGALDAAGQAAAKIGLDVVLLAQTEVAEVSERDGGGSSTMPHKSNTVRATLSRACARTVHAQATLLTSGEHELQRAAGAWHAEWNALSEALAFTGGAVAAARECVEALDVDAERMRMNMTDDLRSEQRAFGIEGDYLGAADAFVERALERHRA